jgi:hypothetical protein
MENYEMAVEKQTHTVGERVEKFCASCGEERGHVVESVTKRGQVSRVRCPKCETSSAHKRGATALAARTGAGAGAPYDQSRTYRAGQSMTHPTFGPGEVTAVIEPHKIDVLFPDRVRRLVHSQTGA